MKIEKATLIKMCEDMLKDTDYEVITGHGELTGVIDLLNLEKFTCLVQNVKDKEFKLLEIDMSIN